MKFGSVTRIFGPVSEAEAETLAEMALDSQGTDCLQHLLQQLFRGDIEPGQFASAVQIQAEDHARELRDAAAEARKDQEGSYT